MAPLVPAPGTAMETMSLAFLCSSAGLWAAQKGLEDGKKWLPGAWQAPKMCLAAERPWRADKVAWERDTNGN